MEAVEAVEVPSWFLCPISLQIMRDPVTLPTGITYDRQNIEHWFYSMNNTTCPVTKLPVSDCNLTPNHTLRRLIQSWCAVNASSGVERFPTPRPPVDKPQILALLDEAKNDPHLRRDGLKKLRTIVSESERNRRCVESSGAVCCLAGIIKESGRQEEEVVHEALGVLCSLRVSEQGLIDLISEHDDFVETLASVMAKSSYETRVYAAMMIKALVSAITPTRLAAVRESVLMEVVKVVRDQISPQATKAALKVLVALCPWGRNRVKAVAGGVVPVLIDLLMEMPERGTCEMALVALDQVCGCAEGRAEVVAHGAGVAVVSKKMLRVSQTATERAVRVLHSIAKYSGTKAVVQEMLQVGAVTKLCMVLQVECGVKTKEKAKEMLRWHARVWRNSPCATPLLHASNPSS